MRRNKMQIGKRIAPCLWFDSQAKEAADFYVSVFQNSKMGKISCYGEAGREHYGKPPGSVLTVEFEIDGQSFTALNGGPIFKFNEAVSFQVYCETQEEIDYYWEKLGESGDENAQQCGWLKDKFGLSWQIVPAEVGEMLTDPDPAKRERWMEAMFQMKKIDIAALKRAQAGP
jgi:predicted 3-demethylubiquinone-9 3-methyltransferase (glyoxalase superfamily)